MAEEKYYKSSLQGSSQIVTEAGKHIIFRAGFAIVTDRESQRFLDKEIEAGHVNYSHPTEEEIAAYKNAIEYGVTPSMGAIMSQHERDILIKYGIEVPEDRVSVMSSGITTADDAIKAQTPETAASATEQLAKAMAASKQK